ncbi:methyltransferase domain-containing protein [Desulfovibrio sp. TomC]|uniref:methyltransferase domain-containing protein n=1 Tax=Desulfovibrio sp. TomC TaxID=1562888 RepID=UPI000574C459|nr:methyltransferase domain-containing protein [Desulfovibrio sp. TomC]KHK01780.1 2-heptaprenyl-1,4-naphthoquinone methyltransferase [Desulfovibrio sp. TomC]
MAEYLATGFAGLDRTVDPDVYVRCLRYLGDAPGMRAIKDASITRLGLSPGVAALEVGCGLGVEAAAMAAATGNAGLAVGLDASQTMLRRAAADMGARAGNRPVLTAGDGARLPFADEVFAACRIERTLQHVADPGAVLGEMARVARPGGVVLAVEPDWGTFVVDSRHVAVTRRLARFWCDSFRCGWIGRRLARLMAAVGLVGIEIVPHSLVLRRLDAAEAVYSLCETADRAAASGLVTRAAAASFQTEQRRLDASGVFFSSLTFFMAVGRKPAAGECGRDEEEGLRRPGA